MQVFYWPTNILSSPTMPASRWPASRASLRPGSAKVEENKRKRCARVIRLRADTIVWTACANLFQQDLHRIGWDLSGTAKVLGTGRGVPFSVSSILLSPFIE